MKDCSCRGKTEDNNVTALKIGRLTDGPEKRGLNDQIPEKAGERYQNTN